ncbi:MAG TPA: cyclopropane-fatty-acyl-phospholipid synthase family protein [Terracidiphilus sp.]|jgi:cyclopropane-fatty-acyl-phospholipid synthase|nr:cyclopropane-fatty-acyl-phospholipid synthase family protein [Terracidiphilus sp.]
MFSSVLEPAQRHLTQYVASTWFHQFAAEHPDCKFAVKFGDGTPVASTSRPSFTLVIQHPGVLQKVLDSPDELTLGELFVNGELDVEGDMEAALQFGELLMWHAHQLGNQANVHRLASILPTPNFDPPTRDGPLRGNLHSRERDRAAIARHYDISNEFYQLWLDPYMQYSAGYFASAGEDLETAQLHKLDRICRKLRLKPGDRFLDIGCGWGGLVLYAAEHYGVGAFGITVSPSQAQFAWERIRTAGLEQRCAVRVCDYRDIEQAEAYDKIASIGMFEHVGETMLKLYFEQALRLLRPGGLFLNSGVAASATYKRVGASFIDTYVFPDGDLVPLHTAVQQAEMSGWEVRHVEGLGEHYALTLDHWVRRLQQHTEQARQATDETTCRTWKLYMAGSARGFRTGRVHLYQMLLAKPDATACA